MEDIEQIKEQAQAWEAVCDTLREVHPGWHDNGVRGMDAACETIRMLAAYAKLPAQTAKIRFKTGTRVVINEKSGFSRGAKGVVEYHDPNDHVWVRRDGAGSAAFFHPHELTAVTENYENLCREAPLSVGRPCSIRTPIREGYEAAKGADPKGADPT